MSEQKRQVLGSLEIHDGTVGLFVDVDTMPDVVMVNGERFVLLPEEREPKSKEQVKGEITDLLTGWAARIEEREPVGGRCADCGEPHWMNAFVPDDVWERIAPEQPFVPGAGGELCLLCIDKRCAALGISTTVRAYFTGDAVQTDRSLESKNTESRATGEGERMYVLDVLAGGAQLVLSFVGSRSDATDWSDYRGKTVLVLPTDTGGVTDE